MHRVRFGVHAAAGLVTLVLGARAAVTAAARQAAGQIVGLVELISRHLATGLARLRALAVGAFLDLARTGVLGIGAVFAVGIVHALAVAIDIAMLHARHAGFGAACMTIFGGGAGEDAGVHARANGGAASMCRLDRSRRIHVIGSACLALAIAHGLVQLTPLTGMRFHRALVAVGRALLCAGAGKLALRCARQVRLRHAGARWRALFAGTVARVALGVRIPFLVGAVVGLVIHFATLVRIHGRLLCIGELAGRCLPHGPIMRASKAAQNRKT